MADLIETTGLIPLDRLVSARSRAGGGSLATAIMDERLTAPVEGRIETRRDSKLVLPVVVNPASARRAVYATAVGLVIACSRRADAVSDPCCGWPR